MMQYLLYKIALWLALNLPLKASYAIARLIAVFQYGFCRRDRIAVISNLRVVLGTNDKRLIEPVAKAVFVNFAKYLVDFFRASIVDEQYIKKFVKIEGREHIKEAFKKGNGVIALTAHIGNWELAGIVTALLGYPVNAVALGHKDKRVDDLFVSQRQIRGVKVIPVGVTVLRSCYSALKNNELIGLLGDRDFTHSGIETEFLGKMVSIPKGPAMFALKAGAAVVPVFMVREPDDSYRLIYERAVDCKPAETSEENIKAVTKKFVNVIEGYIRRYPDQWFMFRKFWSEDANKL